jgi:hypothetical protein
MQPVLSHSLSSPARGFACVRRRAEDSPKRRCRQETCQREGGDSRKRGAGGQEHSPLEQLAESRIQQSACPQCRLPQFVAAGASRQNRHSRATGSARRRCCPSARPQRSQIPYVPWARRRSAPSTSASSRSSPSSPRCDLPSAESVALRPTRPWRQAWRRLRTLRSKDVTTAPRR